MKWFKHMTASWDDEKLAALVGQGGDSGLALYGAYWRFAEIVAKQMEGAAPSCAVTYPVWRWSQLLFVRKSYLTSILVRLKKEGLLVVEGDPKTDETLTVRMPNLLKYRDEYSKKSGHARENVPSRTEAEGEGDTEAEKDLPDATHPRPPAVQLDPPEKTAEELAEEERLKQERLEAAAVNAGIDRVFTYYCRKLKRDPARYTLTQERRKKARARLLERARVSDLDTALQESKQCVDNLAASAHHTEGGYIDWTEQIFRSAEEFEKRLNWQKPQGGSTHVKPTIDDSIAAKQAVLDARRARRVADEQDRAGGSAETGLARTESGGQQPAAGLVL